MNLSPTPSLNTPDPVLTTAIQGAINAVPQTGAADGAGATRVPVSALNRKHEEWTTYNETWEKLSLLYNAGPLLKAQASEFLWQRPKEIKDVFQSRVTAFTYSNNLGAGLTWYLAKLFGQEPTIDLKRGANTLPAPDPASDATPDPDADYYHRFQQDCDRNGQTLADAFRETFRQALLFRKSYTLLDLPPTVQTAASLGSQIVEPYLSCFDPRFAFNWSTDTYGGLEWIVFNQITSEQAGFLGAPVKVRRWYYFDKQIYRVYEHRSDDQQLQNDSEPMARLTDEGPHSMSDLENADGSTGRVPVIVNELPEALWLAGRVFLQVLDHLNTENALRWGLFLGCLAQPFVKTDSEFEAKVAEHGLMQLRQGDEFGWAEPGGKSFEISAQRLASLREEIYRMMYLQAQGKSSTATASAQSGYSKEQDMAASNDIVNAFGRILRAWITLTLVLIGKIRRDKVTFDVRGLSFDDDPQLDDLVAAQQVATLQIQSDTFEKEVQKSIVRVFGKDWNDDLLKQCCKEIDDAPSRTEAAQQQADTEQQVLEQKLAEGASTLVTTAQRSSAKAEE